MLMAGLLTHRPGKRRLLSLVWLSILVVVGARPLAPHRLLMRMAGVCVMPVVGMPPAVERQLVGVCVMPVVGMPANPRSISQNA